MTDTPDYASMSDADLQAHAAALIPAVHDRVANHPGVSARAKRRAAQLHDMADDLENLLFSGGQISARSGGEGKDP